MLKTILTATLLALSLNAFSQSDIELVYSELKLNLPADFTVIGHLGGQDGFLVFRYGHEKGKKYIAFSDMTNDDSIEYGCSVSVFFNDLFSDNRNTPCNSETLKIMRKAFIEKSDVAVWMVNGYKLNYSSDKDKSFVFLSGENGKLIKIDSDFLDKKDYENIFKNI